MFPSVLVPALITGMRYSFDRSCAGQVRKVTWWWRLVGVAG